MILCSNFLVLATCALSPQSELPDLSSVLKTITADGCYEKVNVLADPKMMGRGTLSAGFDLAAEYVEGQLREYGLVPPAENGFRIPITLNCLVAAEDCLLAFPPDLSDIIELDGEVVNVIDQFAPVVGSCEASVSAPAVFVGYAIDSRNNGWRDLSPSKVKGKIVFAFSREPHPDAAKNKKFDGADATRHSQLATKARAVAKAGGVGLVIVPDPLLVHDSSLVLPNTTPRVNPSGTEAIKFYQRSNFPKIPVMTASRNFASAVFGTDIDKYFAKIEKKRRPSLLETDKKQLLVMNVSFENKEIDTYNLAAFIKGDGSSDEIIVLGAHLDHVGLDPNADLMTMTLRPGADDNASGSAALLEVAQALAPHKPKHDILFLWFTGEELGLLGSRKYCESPLVPHEQTIAMFNMDMVGRGDTKKISIGGLWSRPLWADFVAAQHKRIKSKLKMDNEQGRDLYARSDQYSFHTQDVVALFFFEADLETNKSYHQPSDVGESIDGKKMSLIAQLFTACTWAIAYEGQRP